MAQTPGNPWSSPYRLSSEAGAASEGYLASDQYGYVHAVWPEHFDEDSSIFQYARFDGETWSEPIDIYVGKPMGRSMSLAVDQQNTLHLVWSNGLNGPVFYMNVPSHNALSAQHWSNPIRLNLPAHRIGLQVDSNNIIHLLFAKFQEPQPGIYYIRSEDQGKSWSDPLWLDPEIPIAYVPNSLEVRLDPVNDSLHAVWQYNDVTSFSGKDIRYAHSLDGGASWSVPMTIDEADEDERELRAASPVLAVYDHNVHIVWAGTSETRREHRFSTDSGLTWSVPTGIFGTLHGQAFESMTVDGTGRIHFLGQIRYPKAIYHATWDQNHWTAPFPIYRVEGASYYHAHWVRSVVRAGNQVVIMFTDQDDPQRAQYTMHRTLDDISPSILLPSPTPTATPQPPSSPTPTTLTISSITPTVPQSSAKEVSGSAVTGRPDSPLWLALIPVLLLAGGTIVFQLLRRR